MSKNTEDFINSILDNFNRLEYIKTEDIPNIDLYMDQVTTFMDNRLKKSARYQSDDKVLTKTMINNYAKNELLPAPEKKKYSKEHMLLLIFIYYYKSILSISDIQTLLEPITDKFYKSTGNFKLEDVYNEVFEMEKNQVAQMKEDVKNSYLKAQETFSSAPEEDREFLRKFSFICLLSFDIYTKKMIVEKLVDELRESSGYKEEREVKKEAKKEAKKDNKKENKKED